MQKQVQTRVEEEHKKVAEEQQQRLAWGTVVVQSEALGRSSYRQAQLHTTLGHTRPAFGRLPQTGPVSSASTWTYSLEKPHMF